MEGRDGTGRDGTGFEERLSQRIRPNHYNYGSDCITFRLFQWLAPQVGQNEPNPAF